MQSFRPVHCAFRLLRGHVALLWLALAMPAAQAAPVGAARPAFTEPYDGRIYVAASDVPIVLQAFAPDDVFLSAEVFADGQWIGVATFCCPLCPCAHPLPGQETVLQIPAPWTAGPPPTRVWQGWTNVPAGMHRLTARAVGESGTVVESPPVTIDVKEVNLFIGQTSGEEGGYLLVIPFGSLVDGGWFELEASSDLRAWTRLGPFSPGDVAAFYWDRPPASARERRFYRAVWVPSSALRAPDGSPSPLR